jgi:hypothetical protein
MIKELFTLNEDGGNNEQYILHCLYQLYDIKVFDLFFLAPRLTDKFSPTP